MIRTRLNHVRAYGDLLTEVGSSVDEVADVSHANGWNGGINRFPRNIARRTEIALKLRGLGLSCPEIAEALGYSSHSTVVALLRRAQRSQA